MQTETPPTLTVGDLAVSVKRKGRSEIQVANILGTAPGSIRTCPHLVLDRIVHNGNEEEFLDADGCVWCAHGAFVTEIIRTKEQREQRS